MPDDLNTLSELTPTQLRQRWAKLGLRGDPPKFKQAMVRGIAWHIQSKAQGGIDSETRRLLKAAVRNAPSPVSPPSPASPGSTRQTPARVKQREGVQLRTGTTLVRTWRGHKHEVIVLEDAKRFRYRDTEFRSLSEIAREITGARWSGPRFFGLKKLKGTA